MRNPEARRRRRRIAAVVIITALFLGGGGAAYAYWTTSGAGTGAVTVASQAQTVTVVQTSMSGSLAPGATVTLGGTFTNPGATPVYVASISATIGSVSPAGCNASDFTIGQSPIVVGQDIKPGTSQGNWSGLTITMADTNVSQDACKGATVSVNYTASPS